MRGRKGSQILTRGSALGYATSVFPLNEVRVTFSPSPGQLAPGSRPPPQVYVDLIHSYNSPGEYSSCFTELQRDFVIARPTKLKSLIRLVKHWYRQVRHTDAPTPLPVALGFASGALSWEEAGPALAGTLGRWRFFLAAGPQFSYLYNGSGIPLSQELMEQCKARHLA